MTTNAHQAEDHRRSHAPGDLLGEKYLLLRPAGEGAMGAVWIAKNLALEVEVALKLIRPDVAIPLLGAGLEREARAAAALSHPGIVRIFDIGSTPRGEPFIVMEALTGEDLRTFLQREGTISAERAVALVVPIASAMHAAHLHGVIHRDLKPENIILADAGDGKIQPKVVDFGIAKLAWLELGETAAEVVGTLDYMPPEQLVGLPGIDRRADIWSLCAVLYELVSGSTPLTSSATLAGALRAVVEDEVPSLVGRSGVDEELWAILACGLEKSPSRRWGSMQELGGALARWLWDRGVLADSSGSSLPAEWLDRNAPPPESGRVFDSSAALLPEIPFLLVPRTRESRDPVSARPGPRVRAGIAGALLATAVMAVVSVAWPLASGATSARVQRMAAPVAAVAVARFEPPHIEGATPSTLDQALPNAGKAVQSAR